MKGKLTEEEGRLNISLATSPGIEGRPDGRRVKGGEVDSVHDKKIAATANATETKVVALTTIDGADFSICLRRRSGEGCSFDFTA